MLLGFLFLTRAAPAVVQKIVIGVIAIDFGRNAIYARAGVFPLRLLCPTTAATATGFVCTFTMFPLAFAWRLWAAGFVALLLVDAPKLL